MTDTSIATANAESNQKRRRKSAEQVAKTEATRQRLLQATAEVVGEQGFAKASIDAITQRAEIAHGAFYLYFSSRQDAFDQVLAQLGQDLTSEIGAAIRDSHDIVELEKRAFQANITFSDTHPYMHRFMTEAELFAPDAYQAFMGSLRAGYVRSLKRSHRAGELADFREEELDAVAVLLMGLRRAIIHGFCLDGWTVKAPSPDIYETLSKLIKHGLQPFRWNGGQGAAHDETGRMENAPPEA